MIGNNKDMRILLLGSYLETHTINKNILNLIIFLSSSLKGSIQVSFTPFEFYIPCCFDVDVYVFICM